MSALPPSLAEILSYEPRDAALFIEALTHGSSTNKAAARTYQRLEFLGDRVLGLTIAHELYRRFPGEAEGQLSARLNGLVAGDVCADVARQLGLPPLVRMGKQARDDGGRDSDNILGDVIEALIGALYLEAGIGTAEAFILSSWGERIGAVLEAPKHPKSALMEWAAANKRKPPEYVIVARDGPDHAPRFTINVCVPHAGEAQGTGTSKQEAEKSAAAALLSQLEKN